MNARRCLKIASRIGTLLEQEIGLGVDPQRMLTGRLYMRDVLLVCDAHRNTQLAELAVWFRRSAAEMPADCGAASASFGAADSGFDPSGFGHSDFGHSGFGTTTYDSQREQIGLLPSPAMLVRYQLEQQRAAARQGGWFAAARRAGR